MCQQDKCLPHIIYESLILVIGQRNQIKNSSDCRMSFPNQIKKHKFVCSLCHVSWSFRCFLYNVRNLYHIRALCYFKYRNFTRTL